MKLDPSQQFYGYPMLVIRDLLKWCALSREGALRQHIVARRLKITERQGWLLLFDLHNHEYIAVAPPVPGRKGQWFELTTKGYALALAKALPPITRRRADDLVNRLLFRAKHINTNPEFLIGISKLVLFGSYLRAEVESLNDLDVAVAYQAKIEEPYAYVMAAKLMVRQAMSEGRRFRNLGEQMKYPGRATKRFLQGNNRSISLHSIEDPILLQTETRQVFPA